jgi:hypothetical protein
LSHHIPEISSPDGERFRILHDLNQGNFWRPTRYWDEIKNSLPCEEVDFYARTMLGLAETEINPQKAGYCWIVECYDAGVLKEYIDEELFKKATNHGFKELAEEFFSYPHPRGLQINLNHFKLVTVKYISCLEPIVLNEILQKDKPLYSTYNLVSTGYMGFAKKAIEQLPSEDAAFFVGPIVDKFILYWFHEYHGIQVDEKLGLAKDLRPYVEFLPTKPIQDLFVIRFKEFFNHLCQGFSDGAIWSFAVEVLWPYIEMPLAKKQVFASSCIPETNKRAVGAIYKESIPKGWFTEGKQKEISQIFQNLCLDTANLTYRPIVPNFSMMLGGIKLGWPAEDWTKGIVVRSVDFFMASKKQPSTDAILNLLTYLPMHFVGYTRYREVLAKGIAMLQQKKKIESARFWQDKLDSLVEPPIQLTLEV